MVRQPVRLALLLGAITALAVSPAWADQCSAPCSNPCPTVTRTIKVTECVPETYTVKRTVYKVECKKEMVEGFRCESVPVQKERVVTCIERIPVTKEEVRKVCHKVTVCEEREVCKKVWHNVEETVTQRRLKSLGHWECREVTPLFGGLCGGHGNRGCNDSCNDSCNNACPRTRNVWVCCPEWECCQVKVCKRVCSEEKCKVRVPVCKTEWREEKVKVCSFECRETKRTEKYTVCETRKVPCQVERTTRVCVPHEETVTCTRYVRREVERQVTCPAPACNECRPSLCDRIRELCERNRCDRGCQRDNCCH
jgi:hypothetical protein